MNQNKPNETKKLRMIKILIRINLIIALLLFCIDATLYLFFPHYLLSINGAQTYDTAPVLICDKYRPPEDIEYHRPFLFKTCGAYNVSSTPYVYSVFPAYRNMTQAYIIVSLIAVILVLMRNNEQRKQQKREKMAV